MRPECIEAVGQAIGRSITQREAEDIEARIIASMKQIARQDPPSWRGMSQEERLQAAARVAGDELIAEAGKRKQRIALTILAHDRAMNRYTAMLEGGAKPFQAVARVLDEASRFVRGVSNEYFSGLIDTLEAVHPKFLGMVEDSRQAALLVREIFGEKTGDAVAAKGARAWLDTVEAMRQRFNAAGGDVGKLDYGYIPQPHDAVRVLRAGREQWVKDILPLMDRARYIDERGVLYNDAQMVELLEQAWETLASGGTNKIEPGKRTGSIWANHGNQSRVLHFKDAGSYLTYAERYNRGGVLSA